VVAVPSRRRPQLVASVAERLAGLGRLPYRGERDQVGAGTAGAAGGNSAFRLASVWEQLQVPEAVREGLERLGPAPVLLVDDLADSRWTLTVAGRALRQAGAVGVLPFTLALAG
jgi:ATP-dependent DNA helicase RecQ